MTNRQVSRMVQIARDFNNPAKLAALVGEEKAREYYRRQREVASKVHRTPPKSLDGMRF